MTALPGKPASNSVQSGQDQLLAVSPGERLQRARKERKLEVTEVAERLNLSPGVVRALEADDYRMLPSATFVKGYLRSYARALDISGDELVRAYEAITGCNVPVKVEPIAAPMISDTRRNQRNVMLAFGLAILLGIGGWLSMTGEPPPSGVAGDDVLSVPASETLSSSGDDSVNPPVVATRPPSSDAEVLASVEATDEPLNAEVAIPIESAAAPVAVDPGPFSSVVAAPVASGGNPVVSPAPASSMAPDVMPAPATDGTGLVNLRFMGECWVEVRDRSGKMVFSSLKRAGEEVTLRAAIPIHVKLGNGDVVNVHYNHVPVNFTTRPDHKVVRLTLGE